MTTEHAAPEHSEPHSGRRLTILRDRVTDALNRLRRDGEPVPLGLRGFVEAVALRWNRTSNSYRYGHEKLARDLSCTPRTVERYMADARRFGIFDSRRCGDGKNGVIRFAESFEGLMADPTTYVGTADPTKGVGTEESRPDTDAEQTRQELRADPTYAVGLTRERHQGTTPRPSSLRSEGTDAARSARAPDQLSLVAVKPEAASPTDAALVRVEGEVIPAPSWSSRAIEAWQKSRGIAPKDLRGRICARLFEIVKLIGEDATVDAWTRYLSETTDRPHFVTPETFARTYRSWLPGGQGDASKKALSAGEDALRRAMLLEDGE